MGPGWLSLGAGKHDTRASTSQFVPQEPPVCTWGGGWGLGGNSEPTGTEKARTVSFLGQGWLLSAYVNLLLGEGIFQRGAGGSPQGLCVRFLACFNTGRGQMRHCAGLMCVYLVYTEVPVH